MYKSKWNFSFLVVALTIISLSFGATSALADSKGYFIDLLVLQDGKSAKDAKVYFDKVIPIIARHGLRRITPSFEITQNMAGDINPHLVNVWSVSDQQNTMKDIFSDPAYLKNVPLRNSIFDMNRSYMFMMKATK